MTTFIDTSKGRLVKYLNSKGISAPDFYRTTGLKRGLIDNDKLSQQLSSDKIATIIDTYDDLNLEWLITGEGQMLKEDNENLIVTHETTSIYSPKYKEPTIEEQYVPYYSFEATAGILEHLDSSPEYEVSKIVVPNMPRCDGAVSITGDSMYPLLKSGDIVAYRIIHDITNLHYGDMYLVCLNEDGDVYITVKWVKKHPTDPSKAILASHNENYPPREVELRHVHRIALIKFSIRYNSMG